MKVKRLISIFVVVALLASLVVFPVSAADFDSDLEEGKLIDLLDYGNSVESDTNYQKYMGSASFNYELPSPFTINYVDIVIRYWGSSGNDLKTVNILRNEVFMQEATFVKVTTGVYRIYGNITNRAFSSIGIELLSTDSTSATYSTVLSFKVGTFLNSTFSLGGKCEVYADNYSNVFTHYYNEISFDAWTGTDDYDNAYFNLAMYCTDWYKYDFIDFSFGLMVSSIVSVSAILDGVPVPIQVSYIENTFDTGTLYYVTVRIDLRGVNRSLTSKFPELQVSGTCHLKLTNSICIYDITGHTQNVYENPVIYWFKKTFASIVDGFSNVVSKLTSGFSDLATKISTGFSNVVSKLTSGFSSVVNAITGNSAAADQAGEDMEDAAGGLDDIGNAFDNVGTPDIDAGALTGNYTNFSPGGLAVLAAVTSNQYVTAMLVVVFTFALFGFIFFGKKR